MENTLVAGRECGSCNVCCVALTIDEPALQKPQGYRCKNALPDNSCVIYDARPRTCRNFFCGWRRLKWIRETLRPDKSGVLVRLHQEGTVVSATPTLGVIFTILNRGGLKADGLAESVAAAVEANIPVYLHVPGPPGHTASQVQINEVMADPVYRRDKPAVLKIIRKLREIGRAADHEPIVLRKHGPDGTTGQPADT